MHRRGGEAAELDLASDLLDQLVALVLGHLAHHVGHVRHDRVDLVLGPIWETRVRSACGPDAESYTRGRRAAIDVTTSHEFVPRAAASSAAVIHSWSCLPS